MKCVRAYCQLVLTWNDEGDLDGNCALLYVEGGQRYKKNWSLKSVLTAGNG